MNEAHLDDRLELTTLIESMSKVIARLVRENVFLRGQVDGFRQAQGAEVLQSAASPFPNATCERCKQPFEQHGRQKVCDKCFRITAANKIRNYQRKQRNKNTNGATDESRV